MSAVPHQDAAALRSEPAAVRGRPAAPSSGVEVHDGGVAGGGPGRVLLVCHAFATPGHTGGFRWRALTRELARRGWRFDVVAAVPPSGPEAPSPDPERVRVHAVPGDWWLGRLRRRRLLRHLERERAGRAREGPSPAPVDPAAVPVVGPGQPLGAVEHLRTAALGALDAAHGAVWRRRALRLARRLVAAGDHALVLGTTPEPAAQDAAAALARESGLPFVAEYRDPRVFGRGVDRARLDLATRRRERRAELRALEAAAAVVDIAAGAGRRSVAELRAAAPALAALPRVTIPSGYEPAEAGPVDPERFEVLYGGWLWPFMPLPALLGAAGRVARRLDAEAGHRVPEFGVTLVGVERRFNGVPLDTIAEGAGLAGRFRARPRLAREEVARLQERAAVLVAFDSVCASAVCIPSKLYHCARCRGELLPIGRPDGAMAEEAAKIDVATVAPEDGAGIEARLRTAWDRWRRGELVRPADREGRFEVRHRADEMAALFERVRVPAPTGRAGRT